MPLSSDMSALRPLVMKFGGTSVGTPEAIAQVVEISRQTLPEWPHQVIVVSALSGITDLLLSTARQAAGGDTQIIFQAAQSLRSRHMAVIDVLVSDLTRQANLRQEINHLVAEFTSLCHAIAILGEATPRALDTVVSTGERMSVRLIAAALEANGIPAQWVEATQLIVTDDQFQNAHPDLAATTIRTRQILGPLLAQGRLPVVTGFIAATPSGITTTLGRGGSDYSAALLGAALPATEVWIWTDVDGVMSADPRLVPNAHTIPELSYREISELAYFGAKVLHPRAIHPVVTAGIGLRICNTFNPSNPGTRLAFTQSQPSDGVIKSVTAIRGLKLVTVEGRGMLGVPGVAAKTFTAVASTGTSVPFITQASSEQSICFAVPADTCDKVITALETIFASEIVGQDIDHVWASHEVVIITVVGAGLRTTPGIAGRIFTVLGQKGVNVIAIAQGSSEVAISMVASAEDTQAAVRALHTLIENPHPEES